MYMLMSSSLLSYKRHLSDIWSAYGCLQNNLNYVYLFDKVLETRSLCFEVSNSPIDAYR